MHTVPQLRDSHRLETTRTKGDATGVLLSIVIPCFNEADGIANLHQRLEAWAVAASPHVTWECILVDDGSKDRTIDRIAEFFGSDPRYKLVKHNANFGITTALSSGFKSAAGRWVACLDADCTYDPSILDSLLSAVESGFDVVTASPYHAEGAVKNVARWRIALSKLASRLYKYLMQSQLSCYTCCVRIYDSELLKACPDISAPGFVGVTELLWHLDRGGARIGEVPAVLHPRETGVSKMRTLRTALRHLQLMIRILRACPNRGLTLFRGSDSCSD